MNGFENEKQIIEAINSIAFKNLSSDLKNVLKKINNGTIPRTLSAEKHGGTDKADLSITIDSNVYFISVKKGTGNSVHQEPIEDFINFLRINFEDDNSVFNDLRHFIWETFSSHYLELVKSRAYNQEEKFTNKERNGAVYTLNLVLDNL